MRKFIISMFIVLSTLITPILAYEIDEIPEYNGNPYVEIHDNEPVFSSKDMNTKSFESYSNLDFFRSATGCVCECVEGSNANKKNEKVLVL